jgi:hypothetical protein
VERIPQLHWTPGEHTFSRRWRQYLHVSPLRTKFACWNMPAIRGGHLTKMIFKPRHIRALCRWSLTSITRAGSYFSSALTSHSVVTPSLRTSLQSSSLFLGANQISDIALLLYSDAFVLARTPGDPDELRGGLGGYAHGYWWHHPLPRHITLQLATYHFMGIHGNGT